MNEVTSKSFWLFLTLYLGSSFIFLFSSSYWFYTAQTSSQKSSDYYKLKNISDQISTEVIKAHMMEHPFKLKSYDNTKVGLYDENRQLKYGTKTQEIDFDKDYYMKDDIFTIISQGTADHLEISYVVVQSTECASSLKKIREKIILSATVIAMFIIVISVALAKMFLRPIKNKIREVEEFVKDTTHELNTPITALMMSTSRAKNKKSYDEKIIQNISISTKQLYEIYSSLSYLSFESKEEDEDIMFDNVVQGSIKYFDELLERKNISLLFNKNQCKLHIAPTKAKMLINNLLSNSIKYSHPNSSISIDISQEKFIIKDEGIGIKKEKLNTIFKRFSRANSYAGGFGVGLNIVDSIVKKYGFKIEIDSQVDAGTSITIYFN
ncbi:MAG: HAMP domain-containing histidine kinase [Sulfurimonas sp.]|nr:HAMP domain-containing histidine kinase [Sulfurimonas sp.]